MRQLWSDVRHAARCGMPAGIAAGYLGSRFGWPVGLAVGAVLIVTLGLVDEALTFDYGAAVQAGLDRNVGRDHVRLLLWDMRLAVTETNVRLGEALRPPLAALADAVARLVAAAQPSDPE